MVMTSTLMKEIEKLPNETKAELLDFVLFLRMRKPVVESPRPTIESLFGTLPDLTPGIEREEEDRI